MNESQRKTLTIGLFVLAVVLFFVGLADENGTVALVLPTICLFGGFYLRSGRDRDARTELVSPADIFADNCIEDLKNLIPKMVTEIGNEIDEEETEDLIEFFARNPKYFEGMREDILRVARNIYTTQELVHMNELRKSPLGKSIAVKRWEFQTSFRIYFEKQFSRALADFEDRWKV
jgi:hypothetical protein